MICPTCNFDNLPGSEQCRNCWQDLTQCDRPVAHDRVEHSLMEDPVDVLQPRQAVTLAPSATVGEAIQAMLAHEIGALLVVADDGRLLGIITERDLLVKIVGRDEALAEPVRAYMTADPETVRSSDTLALALNKMDCGGYRHLPVLHGGRLAGMISVRDMIQHITRLCRNGS